MGFTKANGTVRLGGQDLGDPWRRTGGRGWVSAMRPKTAGCSQLSRSKRTSCCPDKSRKLNPEETRRRLERAYSVLPELKELAKRPAGSVSGGQGKMVALGRALMLGTRLIILDEPFQGLAPVLAQRYAEALRRLRSQDKDITLLITELNPKLLETFADVTLTIERGEITS